MAAKGVAIMDDLRRASQSSSLCCTKTGRIIIGVDYGTTGTAISVIFIETQDDATGSVNSTQKRFYLPGVKYPSRIAYSSDNPTFSMSSQCWGFQIEPAMNAYSWTKLLLNQNADFSEFDDEVLRLTVSRSVFNPASGKAAVDVVADYLRHALRFTMDAVRRELYELLDYPPIDIQFAIPATWSQESQELSRQAMTRAWSDIRLQDSLTLIPEPEAAAETVYEHLQPRPKIGDGILICDCGGGTVDIATYSVTDCNRFSLSKITAMQGGKCGGTAIDSRLYDLPKRRLPPVAFDHLNHLIVPGSTFMKEFENSKEVFGLDEAPEIFKLPLDIRIGKARYISPYLSSNNFLLSKGDFQSLFDPVIFRIIRLINSQIMAAGKECGFAVIKRIVLVGGLASSPYFQRALRQLFESSGKLLVTVPPQPIMAVAAGSAMHGLRKRYPAVPISPQHYGVLDDWQNVAACRRRNAGNGFGEQMLANSVVSWVLTKGREYHQGYTTTQPLFKLYQDGDSKVMTIPVYFCGLEHPPSAIDDSIKLAGIIVADLSSADLEKFPQETFNNKTFYQQAYRVKVVFDAENWTLHFSAEVLGKTVGASNLRMHSAVGH